MSTRTHAEWRIVLVEQGNWSPERFDGWWARMHPPRPSKAMAALSLLCAVTLASMVPGRVLAVLASLSWLALARFGHHLYT